MCRQSYATFGFVNWEMCANERYLPTSDNGPSYNVHEFLKCFF